MKRRYFDHNATTPVAREVADAMADELRLYYGNASSVHQEGQEARQRLESARRTVAGAIAAGTAEIVFTSGGTEANNLAIRGAVGGSAGWGHVITTRVEHPSVLEPCRQLEREGVSVTYLPVNGNGRVDPDDVQRHLRPETRLVSVMHANNETGVIQPVEEIAAIVRQGRENGLQALMHSDGVQALGRIPLNIPELGVDFYSLSAHKVCGPKGVGALFVRKGMQLEPLQRGGRQERGRRPGTENVPGAVGFAAAIELLPNDLQLEEMEGLRDSFELMLLERLTGIDVNAGTTTRLSNTSNVYFEGIDGAALVIALDLKGFSVSSGSACSSGSVEPSHVLMASGLSEKQARGCVRFSLGRGHTFEDICDLADAVIESVNQLRSAHGKEKHGYAVM